jgi:hypothetical protein
MVWDKMRNQSERQLGAFIAAWVSKFAAAPAVLSDKQARFRNSVIHKGYIPTVQEAIDFAQVVMDIVSTDAAWLKERLPEQLRLAVSKHLFDSRERSPKGVNFSTSSISTIYALTRVDAPCSVVAYVEELKERWRRHGVPFNDL